MIWAKIPDNIPPTTQEVNLNGNKITIVLNFIFKHLTKSDTIWLEHNDIDMYSFYGVKKILRLYVAFNKIKYYIKQCLYNIKTIMALGLRSQ